MTKQFNTEGVCIPAEHYMVPLDHRLDEIELLIRQGKYFMINRARQCGKTTTLQMLQLHLEKHYHVFSISLEGVDCDAYANADSFCRYFYSLLYDTIIYDETKGIPDVFVQCLKERSSAESARQDFRDLGNFISQLCKETEKPVVLMIDKTDQAGEYDIFLKFLGLLRNKYLKRQNRPTFRSVILAGVHDIKNLKRNIRPDAAHQYNSPWNIAADFLIDMNFSTEDIIKMLAAYEGDHQLKMELPQIAELIYAYTSGYPYLVSRICKLIDERITISEHSTENCAWNRNGILAAVKLLLNEPCSLFDDMRKKLDDYPEMRKMITESLFQGLQVPYNPYNQVQDIGLMFGFLKEQNGNTIVANRIFEMFLYNLFLSEQMLDSETYKSSETYKQQFISKNNLNFTYIMQKFVEHFTEVYGDNDQKFIEENGRRIFLLYLKPIINGNGNYYVEARTRDRLRTDIIIDYSGKQYVVELKIWHGTAYHERGEKQLLEYLDAYHLTRGYMLSFNFNKKKVTGLREIALGDKVLVEAVV